jgi:hypothetical protein
MKRLSELPIQVRSMVVVVTSLAVAFQIPKSCLAAGKTHLPPGAFLKGSAANTAALIRQIDREGIVIQRYSRLYHLSPEMIKAAFARLRLIRLKSSEVVRVYYVHKGELLGYKVRRMPKGALVFALPNGTPVLAQVCGNPLRNTPLLPADLVIRKSIPLFNPEEPVLRIPPQRDRADLHFDKRPNPSPGEANRFTMGDFVPEQNLPALGSTLPTSSNVPHKDLGPIALGIITQVTTGQSQSPPVVVPPSAGTTPGGGSGGNGGIPPGGVFPPGGGDIPPGSFGPPPESSGPPPGSSGTPPGSGSGGGGGQPPPGGNGNPGPGGGVIPPMVTPEGDGLALFLAGLAPILLLGRKYRRRSQ